MPAAAISLRPSSLRVGRLVSATEPTEGRGGTLTAPSSRCSARRSCGMKSSALSACTLSGRSLPSKGSARAACSAAMMLGSWHPRPRTSPRQQHPDTPPLARGVWSNGTCSSTDRRGGYLTREGGLAYCATQLAHACVPTSRDPRTHGTLDQYASIHLRLHVHGEPCAAAVRGVDRIDSSHTVGDVPGRPQCWHSGHGRLMGADRACIGHHDR